MPLTEAQRLAFLKGREKRMANLEKKKLEDKEALQNEMMRLIEEEMANADVAPEKPKVARKPRKTKEAKEAKAAKVPVEVKVNPSEADTEPETDPDTVNETKSETNPKPLPAAEPAPAVSESSSSSTGIKFDEDAIANRVVAMLLEKGVGLPAPHGNEPPPLKAKKPRVARATSASSKPRASAEPNQSVFPQSYPPQPASFSWM